MATKNPKVTSYLSPEVYDSLVGYQKSNRIASLSGAITAILAEYLQAEESPADSNGVSSDLSSQVDSLAREFAALQKRIISLEGAVSAQPPAVSSPAPVAAKAPAASNGKASQAKSAKAKPVAAGKAKSSKASRPTAASKAKSSKASRPTATSKAKSSKASGPTAASKAKPSKAGRPTSKAKPSKAKIPAAALEGMTQGQLCQQFGINTKNVSKKARAQGVTSQEYMQSVTGWDFRDGKYYPPV